MKKWHLGLFILFFSLILFILTLFFLKQKINKNKISETQFPLSEYHSIFTMNCNFNKIIVYQNYNLAPILPNDWKCLASITCNYTNIFGKQEEIFVPLRLYNTQTKEFFIMGTDSILKDEARVKLLTEHTDETFYIGTIKGLWNVDLREKSYLTLNITYPDGMLNQNQSNGAGFESLDNTSPPYAKDQLNSFYQTGETKYLPKFKGQRFFWPISGYVFKNY